MIKISSTAQVSGFLYDNEELYDIVKNEVQTLDGFLKFKLYIDKSESTLIPTVNIVIILKKEYEIMNTLDSSLERAESILEWEFKYRVEKVKIYALWK